MEMVKRLTDAGGMFHDGMLHFSETMIGLETSVSDMWHRFQADFGDTINEFGAMFAKFLINNDAWKKASDWLEHLHGMAHVVSIFISTFPTSDLQAKFQPLLDKLKVPFDPFNAWPNTFFTTVNDPISGTHKVLNATGNQAIKDAIKNMTDAATAFGDFMTDPNIVKLAQWTVNDLASGLKAMAHDIGFFVKLMADASAGQWGKAWQDVQDQMDWVKKENLKHDVEGAGQNDVYKAWKGSDLLKAQQEHIEMQERLKRATGAVSDSEDKNRAAIDAATASMTALTNAMGGGSGYGTGGSYGAYGKGLSDKPGAVYEQYGYEGHAANYGPHGNRLGEGYGIGIGQSLQASSGARYGKWVKVRFADGTTMWRQVNETSERNRGIEFFTNHPGEYNRHGSAHIEQVYDRKPDQASVNIHYNIQALDSHGIHRILNDHVDAIATALRRHGAMDLSRAVVV